MLICYQSVETGDIHREIYLTL